LAQQIYSQLTGGGQLPNITSQFVSVPKTVSNIVNKNGENTPSVQKEAAISGNSFIDRVNQRLSAYSGIITAASEKFGVPEYLIKAIITAESAGKADAKSSAGAKGLMQLMDGTAKSLGVKNSYNPAENIMGGTEYISNMLKKFNGNIEYALAGYNAGPGNVDKYGGIPPFKETQNYVKRVKKYIETFRNES
jgi:soluble lytic murein transglycosylase-like protein